MKPIWNGTGSAEGLVAFTKHSGELVGRPYVRQRVAQYLARSSFLYSLERRRRVIANTVDNDAWLAWRNQHLVASICRDVMNALHESEAT